MRGYLRAAAIWGLVGLVAGTVAASIGSQIDYDFAILLALLLGGYGIFWHFREEVDGREDSKLAEAADGELPDLAKEWVQRLRSGEQFQVKRFPPITFTNDGVELSAIFGKKSLRWQDVTNVGTNVVQFSGTRAGRFVALEVNGKSALAIQCSKKMFPVILATSVEMAARAQSRPSGA